MISFTKVVSWLITLWQWFIERAAFWDSPLKSLFRQVSGSLDYHWQQIVFNFKQTFHSLLHADTTKPLYSPFPCSRENINIAKMYQRIQLLPLKGQNTGAKLTTCMPVLKWANPHDHLHAVPCEVVLKSLVPYSTACCNKHHHHRKMVAISPQFKSIFVYSNTQYSLSKVIPWFEHSFTNTTLLNKPQRADSKSHSRRFLR